MAKKIIAVILITVVIVVALVVPVSAAAYDGTNASVGYLVTPFDSITFIPYNTSTYGDLEIVWESPDLVYTDVGQWSYRTVMQRDNQTGDLPAVLGSTLRLYISRTNTTYTWLLPNLSFGAGVDIQTHFYLEAAVMVINTSSDLLTTGLYAYHPAGQIALPAFTSIYTIDYIDNNGDAQSINVEHYVSDYVDVGSQRRHYLIDPADFSDIDLDTVANGQLLIRNFACDFSSYGNGTVGIPLVWSADSYDDGLSPLQTYTALTRFAAAGADRYQDGYDDGYREGYREGVEAEYYDLDFTSWLSVSIQSIWDFRLLPNFTVGEVFGFVLGLLIIFILLRLFL